MDATLTGALEVLNRAKEAAQSDGIRAVRLCFAVLPEAYTLLDHCDDSNGDVGKAREFLLGHLYYHDFRQQAIARAMEASDYETALRYAQDGLAQDGEGQRPGICS